MTGREVSEAELDRVLARSFGRDTAEDVALLEDLERVGMTRAGARGVLSWADDGMAAKEAAAMVGPDQVKPGKVRFMVVERAAEVLRRHRPAVDADASRPGSAAQVGSTDRRLSEIRESLIEARHAQNPGPNYHPAVSYANGCIDSVTERALREGWSFEQVLARLEERVTEERARVPGSGSSASSGGGSGASKPLASPPAAAKSSWRTTVVESTDTDPWVDIDAALGIVRKDAAGGGAR